MVHAADDKKHNIINILVVFGAYVCYFYRFNPKMYLNKIPPSVERDGMFYISRKEIELIKEILNSRDKIVINGLHFLSIHLKALVAYSTTKTTTGKTTMIMLKQK